MTLALHAPLASPPAVATFGGTLSLIRIEDIDGTLFWVLLAFQALACAGLTSYLASRKGYRADAWLIIGLVLGILGLITAWALPMKSAGDAERLARKPCPSCAEPIRLIARRCVHCGAAQSEEVIVDSLVGLVGDGMDEKTVDLLCAATAAGLDSALLELAKKPHPAHAQLSIVLARRKVWEAGPILVELMRRAPFPLETYEWALIRLAHPATIPPLIDMALEDKYRSDSALRVLRGIGREAVEPMKAALGRAQASSRAALENAIESIEHDTAR